MILLKLYLSAFYPFQEGKTLVKKTWAAAADGLLIKCK